MKHTSSDDFVKLTQHNKTKASAYTTLRG